MIPPPSPSPFNWGDPDWLKDALGEYFELSHETGELTHRLSNAEQAWRVYEDGFGPIRVTSQALNTVGRKELQSAFVDWVSQFNTGLGVALTYQYLITIGVRI